MMNAPKISAEIDDNFQITLVITCGKCGAAKREKLENIHHGREIRCACGVIFQFEDSELTGLQDRVRSLYGPAHKLDE